MADGPSEVEIQRTEKGEEKDTEWERRKKKPGKMGSQLFFRLAYAVPLAIIRLERNVFSGLFSGLTHL